MLLDIARLMRTVTLFLAVPAVMYVGLCLYVYAAQRSQIYFPTPETHVPGAQVVRLESHGESLKIWVIPRAGPRALVYFGGNAEDVSWNIEAFSAALPDQSLYLVNYRGYGGSTGRPSQAGLFADALTVYDHVRAQRSEISLMGRSLGSGVAVYVASQRPAHKLVLVTPYDSLVNVARSHFRFLPVGLLLRDRYESARRTRDIKAPVLMVIAEDDEIVPRARSEALSKAFPLEQVRVQVVRGAMHNSLDLSPEYLRGVRTFLMSE
jgi:pimeloyl-ACP methyl ester carboxylesterase